MVPFVATEPPADWGAVEVAPPKIAESSGATLSRFSALGPIGREPGEPVLATGCVATPIPGWVEDMRPAVSARTTALAGAVAERIRGVPVDARDENGVLTLRAASDLGAPPLGSARTFVGFDATRVFTCFAVCAATPETRTTGTRVSCHSSVLHARLEGDAPPPTPSAPLRAVTWAVHHPRPTAMSLALVAFGAGILAVATRRRPRTSGRI